MKRKVALLAVLLFAVGNVFAISLNQLIIVAEDGTYLGSFESEYSSNSVYNKYSNYGSPYSSNSIMNKYGSYGSDYSQKSPFNKYSSEAPCGSWTDTESITAGSR